MDSYFFTCHGHPNVLGNHGNTFEFTKDDSVTLNGDCIIGLKADFKLAELKKFLEGKDKIKIKIECNGESDEVECSVNKDFNDEHEIVIRNSEFNSKRTLGVRANKASCDINRKLIENMKSEDAVMKVEFS